ncbi:MAG: hypothetical protein KC503_04960 [Myxococcales bacterium]|nr:hypothetical protein [Myxococcales bacterium]
MTPQPDSPTPKPQPNQPATAAAAAAKVLRVGVVMAGRVVEERIVRDERRVTLGASPHSTFCVPGSALPRRVDIFERTRDGRYRLVAPTSVGGRLYHDGQLRPLAEHQAAGGKRLDVMLDDDSRGRLELADVTLLFQLVSAPPRMPRPRLPASLRARPLDRLDMPLAASFTFLAALAAGFGFYLSTVELPHRSPTVVPDGFPQLTAAARPVVVFRGDLPKKVGEKPVKPKQPKAKASDDGRKTKRRHARKSPAHGTRRASNKKQGPACDAACQAKRRRARLAKALASQPVFTLIGSPSARGRATAYDQLRRGDPSRKIDKALDGATAMRTGPRTDGLRVRGTNKVKRASIGDLNPRISGPTRVDTGTVVKERVPEVDVRPIGPPPTGPDAPPADVVARRLRRLMPAFRNCYQRAIKRGGIANGKISLRLDLSVIGRTIGVEVERDTIGSPVLKACVTRTAKRFRIPPQKRRTELALPLIFRRK